MVADNRMNTPRIMFRRTITNLQGTIFSDEIYEVSSDDLDECYDMVEKLKQLDYREERNDRKIPDPSVG
jgi:hypothetical protein